MAEENGKLDILLADMLEQMRVGWSKLDDISQNGVRKDDFQRFEDKLERRFDNYDDKLDAHNVKLVDHEAKVETVVKFRDAWHNAGKWCVRVVGAAVLGLLVTAAAGVLVHNFSSAATTSPVSASSSPTFGHSSKLPNP